jgi:hypothetical protein
MNIETAIEFSPLLHQLYDQDITVFVVDTEKVIYTSISEKLDIGVREGQSMEMYKQSGAYHAMISGERVIARINDKQRFHIPYVAMAAPIIDNGNIVGAISIIVSTEHYDRLVRTGEEVLAAIEEVYATAENLSAQSEELSATSKSMDAETVLVKQDINHVNSIATEIKKISAQSNILGINASIESARAGSYGAGFKVVADEVRKLADHTKESAVKIEEDLDKVQESVNSLIESLSQIATVSEFQAIGITELTQALGQISKLAEQLTQIGKI